MKRVPLVLALVVALCLGTGLAAAEDQDVSTDSTPHTCDSRSAARHIKDARRTIDAGWSLKHWRHGPKKAQERRVQNHIGCLKRAKDRSGVQSYRAQKIKRLRLYRAYRAVATIRCQSGPYGFWAIPCYIIECESHFSWSAYNPSGARGAYQFLGWPVPWPVRSFRDKLAHHRMAAALSLSNWVCA